MKALILLEWEGSGWYYFAYLVVGALGFKLVDLYATVEEHVIGRSWGFCARASECMPRNVVYVNAEGQLRS